jgi:hypothetical protein
MGALFQAKMLGITRGYWPFYFPRNTLPQTKMEAEASIFYTTGW